MLTFNNHELIGITRGGGNGYGTIFKTDLQGENHEILSKLSNTVKADKIASPFVVDEKGRFFGVCEKGGKYDEGMIFEIKFATSEVIPVHQFGQILNTEDLWDENGENPQHALTLGIDGNLYGTTSKGGAFGWGTLFQFNLSENKFTKLFDFNDTSGKHVSTPLIYTANGILYGLTNCGGSGRGWGTLFSYNLIDNTFKIIELMLSYGQTSHHKRKLIKYNEDILLVLLPCDGTDNSGQILQLNLNDDKNKIKYYSPFNKKNCHEPYSLLKAQNNKLYGISRGGKDFSDVLFEYDLAKNKVEVKFTLKQIAGQYMKGDLIEGSNGLLYGFSVPLGSQSPYNAPLFEYNYITNKFKILHQLDRLYVGLDDINLTLHKNQLYGVTTGIKGTANLIQFNLENNTDSQIHELNEKQLGCYPAGNLIKAADGNYYGVTSQGGEYNAGVLFKYDATLNNYSCVRSFNLQYGFLHTTLEVPEDTGCYPIKLLGAIESTIYGAHARGGKYHYGGIFEYSIVTNSYHFYDIFRDNEHVISSCFNHLNTSLYYSEGSSSTRITKFNLITKEIKTIAEFYEIDEIHNNYNVYGLIKHTNGNLYGLCEYTETEGEENRSIFLFQVNLNKLSPILKTGMLMPDEEPSTTLNEIKTLLEIPAELCNEPIGNMVEAPFGKLYGIMKSGGSSDFGVIFEVDLVNNSFNTIFDFPNSTYPTENLSFHNNKLIGFTKQGGKYRRGTLFTFDIETGDYTTKIIFNGENGTILS